MKIMGNDLITQGEFDEFLTKTIKPMHKEIEDLNNQVKTLFAGLLICVIAAAVLLIKLLH